MHLPVEDFTRGLVPLWAGRRGDSIDFVRLGAFALVDAEGHLRACCGDANLPAFLRSSAKPFQALAFLRRGLDTKLSLSDEDVACACASHSGEDRHVAAARRILAAAGLDDGQLLCGTHEAIWPELQRRIRDGETAYVCAKPTAQSLIETLEQVLQDQAAAHRLAESAQNYIREHHTVSAMAGRLAATYRNLAVARATFPLAE